MEALEPETFTSLIWIFTTKVKQSVLGWKTHVAGNTSGHFTVNTVPKQLINLNSGTMGKKRAQALEKQLLSTSTFMTDKSMHFCIY